MPAVELLPYQKASFIDRGRFKLLFWARGCRKTWTATLEIVDDCFNREQAGQRTTWLILSRGERQSLEAINEAKRHCKAYLMAANIEESEFVSEDGLRRYTQQTIRFPGGSRIIALPSNPDTARGYTANVFLDEFCIHEHDEEIWRAIYPTLRGRLRMIISSTAKGGQSRVFYRLWHNESDLWSRHQIDIYEAVRQGLEFDIETEKEAMDDEDGWAQEMELKWLEASMMWLPYGLIQSCEHKLAGQPHLYEYRTCYGGNDIGRRGDLWIAWVIERIGDILWTREVSVLKDASFEEHDAEMDRLHRNYRIAKWALDQTGMGEKPVEDAMRRYGESAVEGVLFTIQNKYMLATLGKKSFEKRKWRTPLDTQCRDDFAKLKRETTLAGNVRFDAQRDNTGHADRAWAGFLALYAAGGDIGEIDMQARDGYTAQDTGFTGMKRPDIVEIGTEVSMMEGTDYSGF